ncbi:uncharacterized protein LOC112563610 [Pomacea canaliculata]|nr:uncharacterized protein LOC112563610 [Pomacea canaliculata]
MEEKEKHVVVMYVPEPTSDKMRDFILAACTQAFDFASSKNLNLALPVQLSDGLQVKTFKTMLCAICEHMEREDTFNDIVLYISDTSQLKTLMDISSKYLMRCEGWYTDVIFRERPETTSGTSHRIKIAVDELQKFKADVLVNSTDRGLEHTHAAVSGLILQTVGPQLQELCHLLYPSGIEDRILAVTPSGIDQWKEIYHIVLPQTWKDQHENYLLSELRKRVQGCLTVASANNHESIAFPTLGTGKLLYPPEKVAHTMFNAARDFFASMPHSTLKKVTIVCFPKNTEIIKVFKAEEALHIFKVDKSLNQEARLGVENRLVQIVVPNTEKEEIPDICDIVYDFIQEDARKKQKGSFMKDKTKTKSLMVIFKKKDKREAVSLQINLMRAGSEDLADIVKAVGKKLSKCLKCLIVIMAVADVSSLRSVCEEFQAQQKASSFWNPFSWLTGGKSEMKSPVNPSFSKSPPKQEIGVICVCGNSGVFDKVKAEMKKIFIPEKYRQLAAELNDGVSVDSDLGAVNNVVNQNFGQPKKEECILTIPMADLPGLDENAFNPVLNPVTNHKKGCLTFSVPFKDLQAAVDDVTAVIKSADNISQKADVSTLRQIKLNPVIERTVDCLEYEALKYLLGEPFILTKTDEKDGMVTFSIPADRSPEDIDDKIGSLRQEVVSLEGANMSNIENPINTRSEGVEAFMKIIQQERKVVIFCFDYNNMNKAKHLLQVKTGKIKTTSRAARKFGEGLASSTSQQPSADSYSKPADRLELNTKSGIKIYVYKTDITKLPVDGIVNAANNNLQHGGGVAAAIAKAAGPSLEEEGDDYINKHGPLKVSQVISTSSGALPCKTVLHAVGPRWDDYQDKRQCQQDLEQTIFNCLETAHNMKLGSLAVSSISSAIFGVPKNVCAEMYMQAVQRFDDHHGAASCVRHIHFADISDEMVSNIQAVFTQKMNIVASCQHGDSMKAVRSLDTAQQNSSDKMQEDPTVSKKQQNKGETTHPDSSVKDAQQTAKDKIPSTPIVASTQQNMAQSVTRVDSTQQSTHSTALALTSGLDFHSTTNLNKEPAVKVTQSSGVLGLEWTICFHELEYFIGQQDISQITTDAIIFWHIDGRVVDERSLKKLVKTSEFSSFKKKQLAEGKIHTFQGSRCKWLVFVVVPPLNRGSLENVTSIVEKALQKVDNLEAKSVALLHFPHSKEVRKDNEHQAEVFSSALKKLAGRPQKSLKKVYIVNLEEEFISLLGKEVLASIQRNDHRVHGYLSRDQEQLTAENLTEAELTPRNERGDTVVQESAV